MSRRLELALLSVMGTLIVALVVLNVVAFGGGFDGADPASAPAPLDTVEEPEESAAETTTVAATRAVEAAAPPAPPELRLAARRGDCYVQARRGSPQGEVLYDGILRRGQATDFAERRLWLRLGASTNVDARLDGDPLDLPDGTVDVVVTRDGVVPA